MGTEQANGAVARIERVRQAWLDALARGAVDELISMVTDDVVFLPANSPPVVGPDRCFAVNSAFPRAVPGHPSGRAEPRTRPAWGPGPASSCAWASS